MQIIVKTFKGSEKEITEKVNIVLQECAGRWGHVENIKCLNYKIEGKKIELTLLIIYSESA